MGNRKKTKSGPNIPESERHTVAIKLRFKPDDAELLVKRAFETNSKLNDYVANLVREDEKSDKVEETSDDDQEVPT